ncbi:hypothetical protein CWE02_05620, partial [Brucella pituitosa]
MPGLLQSDCIKLLILSSVEFGADPFQVHIRGFRLAFGLPWRDWRKNCRKFQGIFESSKIKVRSSNVMGEKAELRHSLMKTPYLKCNGFNALIAH